VSAAELSGGIASTIWVEGSLKQQLEVVNKKAKELLRMLDIKDDELSPFSIEKFSSNLDN
jgi:hypothetical protein